MNNIFKLVMFVVFTLVSNIVSAETSISANCTYWNQYHGSNGAIFDEDPSLQCATSISLDNGIYAGVWASEDFDGVADFGNEIDLFIGKSGTVGTLNYNAGVQQFFIHQPTTVSGDVINFFANFSRTFTRGDWSFTPRFNFDRYFPVGGSLPGDGENYEFGLAMTRSFNEDYSFTLNPHVLFDSGAFGFEKNEIFFTNVSLVKKLADNVSVVGRFRISTPLGDDLARETEHSIGLQFTWATK